MGVIEVTIGAAGIALGTDPRILLVEIAAGRALGIARLLLLVEVAAGRIGTAGWPEPIPGRTAFDATMLLSTVVIGSTGAAG